MQVVVRVPSALLSVELQLSLAVLAVDEVRQLLELAVAHQPVLAPLEELGHRQVLQLAQLVLLDLSVLKVLLV